MVFPTSKTPQSDSGIGVKLRFIWVDEIDELESLQTIEWGHLYSSIEFKGMINGGYITKITLFDSEMNLLPALIRNGYLQNVRRVPIIMAYRIYRKPGVDNGEGSLENSAADRTRKASDEQYAILFDFSIKGEGSSVSRVEFIGIDPPSWYLNTGDASGGVFQGNVGQVIRQTIERYSRLSSRLPSGRLRYEVTNTRDARTNKWHMMRQDPKTFINSLLEWSSSLTPQKTQWLVAMNGNPRNGGPHISIKEQAEYQSRQRGYYTFRGTDDNLISTIKGWELVNNTALSISQHKIITNGLSMVSGRYMDKATDKRENIVTVSDDTTPNKRIANTKSWMSTKKPSRFFAETGSTSVPSIPEVFSAQDIGLSYDEYIDGSARGLWLGMVNNLMRLKVTVLGHGEWNDTFGLGIDTVTLNWTKEPIGGDALYFLSGSWLVYGFNHRASRRDWYTDLYLARWDHNSLAERVPSRPINLI